MCIRWGVGVGELVFYPLPNSHLLSAPIHSELTDSIAFSRGKEPAQCRGLFSSTLAHGHWAMSRNKHTRPSQRPPPPPPAPNNPGSPAWATSALPYFNTLGCRLIFFFNVVWPVEKCVCVCVRPHARVCMCVCAHRHNFLCA